MTTTAWTVDRDGVRCKVVANVETVPQLPLALEFAGTGLPPSVVCLLRPLTPAARTALLAALAGAGVSGEGEVHRAARALIRTGRFERAAYAWPGADA
jgi:hypothetical protein